MILGTRNKLSFYWFGHWPDWLYVCVFQVEPKHKRVKSKAKKSFVRRINRTLVYSVPFDLHPFTSISLILCIRYGREKTRSTRLTDKTNFAQVATLFFVFSSSQTLCFLLFFLLVLHVQHTFILFPWRACWMPKEQLFLDTPTDSITPILRWHSKKHAFSM